MHADIIQENIS